MMTRAAALSEANATDAATIAAVNASSNALDEAFTKKDVATNKALMTQDHLTVTPYYDGPQRSTTSSPRSGSTIGARPSSARPM
jgi:hypothetical protein